MSIAQNFPSIAPSLSLDFANVQALDPRITYARASTATYYGTRTALAEQNFFRYSQEFDNGYWTKANTTTTANSTAAPDGTTTADTLTASAVTDTHNIRLASNVTPANTTTTLSVFVKAGTHNFITLAVNAISSSVWFVATFDLSTQAVTKTEAGAGGTYTSSSITSVGNSWFRISITGQISSVLSDARIDMASSATPTYTGYGVDSWAATGTETVFIWGAQLETRSLTAYTPTTTQTITNYIPVLETAASGVARFDHNPTTFESLGLLVEQQSTNLLTYSEQFDNASWIKNNTTVTSNTIIAPDGTLTGDALVVTSAGVQCTVVQSATLAAVASTFTCYIKASSASWVCLGSNQFAADFGWFNVSTGVVGSRSGVVTASQIQAVGNGWYRCSVTGTFTANSLRSISVASADGVFTSPSVGSEIYIWGAQSEALAFPTSYIPTVASQVTRAADSASMTGTNFSSWYSADNGTFYGEASWLGLSQVNQPIVGLDTASTQTNWFALGYGIGGFTNAMSAYGINGFLVSNTASVTSANTFYKTAVTIKTNDLALTTSSSTVSTDASGFIGSVDRLRIGTYLNGQMSGTIKKIAYYPLRLSNTNLQALTG
jgi:hypothetical protein